jgi:hypothetical protein
MNEVAYLLVVVVVNGLVVFLCSYLVAKSQNLAKKEDIGEITKAIEDVKMANKLILAQGEWKNQLRLAAVERRLNVHQEAYLLLVKLSRVFHFASTDYENLLRDCSDWWNQHNLFLTLKSREAFDKALEEANALLDLRLAGTFEEGSQEAINRKREMMEKIRVISQLREIIVNEVELPSVALDRDSSINS